MIGALVDVARHHPGEIARRDADERRVCHGEDGTGIVEVDAVTGEERVPERRDLGGGGREVPGIGAELHGAHPHADLERGAGCRGRGTRLAVLDELIERGASVSPHPVESRRRR